MLLGPIYALTDPALLPGERLYTAVAAALSQGIKTIQLRDKQTGSNELRALAIRLVQLCKKFDAQCIINDHVSLALETGAQGVHLGQGDGSVREARRLLGDAAIIGVTCHSDLELARRAQGDGASYIAFGRFYSSNTKPLAQAADSSVLGAARCEIALPVVAIGGIGRDNMAPLLRAGAQTLAVCNSLFGAADVACAAGELLTEYKRITRNDFSEQPNTRTQNL
jgi:thiamine-phosphate pyrophosphorylase